MFKVLKSDLMCKTNHFICYVNNPLKFLFDLQSDSVGTTSSYLPNSLSVQIIFPFEPNGSRNSVPFPLLYDSFQFLVYI